MPNENVTPEEITRNFNLETATKADTEVAPPDAIAGKIAEKWFATIPEADRAIAWTPEQITILLHILVNTRDETSDLFSAADRLGHLPQSILDTLYDEDKDQITRAFRQIANDPIRAAGEMGKVKHIGTAGLPESVSVAFQSIILQEGERPILNVFKDIADHLENSEIGNPMTFIKEDIRNDLLTPQARERDRVRRLAAGILLGKLWPEFATSKEAIFYADISLTDLPSKKEERDAAIDAFKARFYEIFNENFEGEGIFIFSDMADEVKNRIMKKWNNIAV